MLEPKRKPRQIFAFAIILSSMFLAVVLARPINAQSRQDRQLLARVEGLSGDKFPVRTSSPRGVRVYAQQQPRLELLRAIDTGFANLFAVARRHGYRARLDYSSYTVFIAKADRIKDSTGGYSPDIVRFEGEHIILYYNDRSLYEKTKDHSQGGGHPILQ